MQILSVILWFHARIQNSTNLRNDFQMINLHLFLKQVIPIFNHIDPFDQKLNRILQILISMLGRIVLRPELPLQRIHVFPNQTEVLVHGLDQIVQLFVDVDLDKLGVFALDNREDPDLLQAVNFLGIRVLAFLPRNRAPAG